MDDLIEKASTSADAKQSKPEPDIFAAALKKVGMQAEQTVALGDTPYDAQAAGKLDPGIPQCIPHQSSHPASTLRKALPARFRRRSPGESVTAKVKFPGKCAMVTARR